MYNGSTDVYLAIVWLTMIVNNRKLPFAHSRHVVCCSREAKRQD